MKRLFIFKFILRSLFLPAVVALLPLATLIAKPTLEKIEIPKVRAGEVAEIILRGAELQKIRKVDRVKFDEKILGVLSYDIKSDSAIHIRIRIPADAQPGEHNIQVMVSDEVTRRWLAPASQSRQITLQYDDIKSPLKFYYKGQSLNSGDELALLFKREPGGSWISNECLFHNRGSTPLRLDSLRLPAGMDIKPSLPGTLTAGQSFAFRLRTEPGVEPSADTIVFANRKIPGSGFHFRLMPEKLPPPFPKVEISHKGAVLQNGQIPEILFGSSRPGHPAEETIRITNKETRPLHFTHPVLPDGYKWIAPLPEEIPPGESVEIAMRLTPGPAGNAGGEASLEINDGIPHLFIFRVRGNRVPAEAPQVRITSAGNQIFPADTLHFPVTATRLQIGRSLTIYNTDKEILGFKNLRFPQGFLLSAPPPEHIAPGESLVVDIQLIPDSAGKYGGNLHFDLDNGSLHGFDFPLTGRVVPAVLPEYILYDGHLPLAHYSETLIHFDSTLTGSAVEKVFKIKNTSPLRLGLSGLILPSGFQLIGDFPASILPGDSALFTIRMSGNKAGILNGPMRFNALLGTVTHSVEYNIAGIVGPSGNLASSQESPLSFLWSIIIFAILVSAGTAIAFRKKTVFRKSSAKTPPAAPAIRFGITYDSGRQQIRWKENSPPAFSIKLRPLPDEGRQRYSGGEALIRGLETASAEATASVRESAVQDSQTDDLTLIEGIGPKIAQLLSANGINSFRGLTAANVQRLRRILDGRKLWMTDPGTWSEQAGLAAEEKWSKLKALQNELKGGRRIH
ncbi:MAG: choice-of-anchor D domain-containing protein [Calditrichia bacterium]